MGEERLTATAKGEECGHGRNRFAAGLKRNAVKGSKLKKIHCLSVTRFEVPHSLFLTQFNL